MSLAHFCACLLLSMETSGSLVRLCNALGSIHKQLSTAAHRVLQETSYPASCYATVEPALGRSCTHPWVLQSGSQPTRQAGQQCGSTLPVQSEVQLQCQAFCTAQAHQLTDLYVAKVGFPASASGRDRLRMATLPGRSINVRGTLACKAAAGQAAKVVTNDRKRPRKGHLLGADRRLMGISHRSSSRQFNSQKIR
jgi:primosomal replication protein N